MPGTELATTINTSVDTAVPTTEVIDDDPLAGTNYQVAHELGAGGMGRVYCAQHRQLGHLVAVKVLLLDHGADALAETPVQRIDRARIEAQIGARLSHPNLVAVHDYGSTATGLPFLAMELLTGESLHEKLATAHNGPLPLAESLDIICQLLAGLHVVHEAGLIHRDIKPNNVFVCSDGAVKLLDLGCAKVIEHASGLTPDSLVIPTSTHVVLGSPRYMAPEQVSLQLLDRRADIYAVGCVLYRLLCGRGPFDHATTFGQLRKAHLHEPPAQPSTHLREPLIAGLDDVVLRCLAKAPGDRPASAAALAAELRRIELEVRTQLGGTFTTETNEPSTTLGEQSQFWQPAPAPVAAAARPPGSVTVRQAMLAALAALAVGVVVGGAVLTMWGDGP